MINHPLFKRGNIYLSGGMQHSADLGAAWRIQCGKKLRELRYFPLDITELDVAYTERYGQLYRSFDDNDPDQMLQKKSNIRKHFVYTDLKLIIDDSDALIVLYDESARKGAGTISECQVAYNHDLPIFLVNTFASMDEVPGWLQSLTTKMFSSFEDLYAYLDQLPQGILKRDVYGNHHAGSHYLCSLCGDPFEKQKTHFVSKVSPLYCKSCVELVKTTNTAHYDRYHFFAEYLAEQVIHDLKRGNKK